MAWFGDVEIPAELVDAQQKGGLILFAGVGLRSAAHQACQAFAY
jgi:hypothetical protein